MSAQGVGERAADSTAPPPGYLRPSPLVFCLQGKRQVAAHASRKKEKEQQQATPASKKRTCTLLALFSPSPPLSVCNGGRGAGVRDLHGGVETGCRGALGLQSLGEKYRRPRPSIPRFCPQCAHACAAVHGSFARSAIRFVFPTQHAPPEHGYALRRETAQNARRQRERAYPCTVSDFSRGKRNDPS